MHWVPIRLYREAVKQAFFEPRQSVLALYRRYNAPVRRLVEDWWDHISDSARFSQSRDLIAKHHSALKPGDVTLVGLIAEGGQGMRTANNGRFLGYLSGTPKAAAVEAEREVWARQWVRHPRIGPVFARLLHENGGNAARPTANVAAWEACIEPSKSSSLRADSDSGIPNRPLPRSPRDASSH